MPERSEPSHVDVLDTGEAGMKVIHGGALRTAGFVAGTIVNVGAAAILLRHLGVVDVGRYVTVLSLVAIVGGISDFGLIGVGVREYTNRTHEDRDRFMRNLLGMRIVFTGTATLFAVAFALVVGYTDPMVAGTALAGLGYLLVVYQQSLAIPLSASLRLGWITALQLLMQVLWAIAIVILVLLDAGLVVLLGVQIVAVVPVMLLTIAVVHRETPVLPAFDRRLWRSLLHDIFMFGVAIVFGVLYFRIITVLMSLIASPEQTGYYGAAFRVLETLTAIPALLAASAFPIFVRAARDDHARLDYALGRLLEGMLLVGVWMSLCVVLGAPFAIDVVAGPGFEPAVEVLRYMGPALIATFMLATWGYGLLSVRAFRPIVIVNFIALTVAVVTGVALISADGARGGAISLTLAEFTLAIGYGIAVARVRGSRPVAAEYPLRVGAAGAVALLIPLALALPAVPAVILATLIYGGLLLLLRGVPEEILVAIRTAVRRNPRVQDSTG